MGTLQRATIRARGAIAAAATIILTGTPLTAQAVQITPNPNPTGSIINIIDDPYAVNTAYPYYNAGTINIDSASTLTNADGARFEFKSGGALNNAGRLDNYGSVSGLGAQPHVLNNTGTLNNFRSMGVHLVNAVGATVNNYGPLGTGSGVVTNAGTFNNFAGGSTYSGAYALTNSGTINNFAGAQLWSVEGTLPNAVGGTINNYGSVLVTYSTLANRGTVNNFGVVQCDQSCVIDNLVGATLTNHAEIRFSHGGLGNAGTFINDGVLSFESPARLVTNSGTAINTGAIAVNEYIQTAGQTINLGTMSLESHVDIQGGTLRGTGTITTPVVTLASGAILAPGDAATLGTLTINGDLHSSGNLWFRLGGTGTGEFDALDINGDALFTGGTVYFDLGEFDAAAGDSWDFLAADSIIGWDTLQFAFNGLSPDLTYAFYYSDGVQTLRLRSVPEPSAIGLLAIALAAIGLARRNKLAPFPR